MTDKVERTPKNFSPLPNDVTKVHYNRADGEYEELPRLIGGVANISKDGNIFLGVRHYCPIMCKSIDLWSSANNTEEYFEQGFVDQYGTFMSRKEAKLVALSSGQIIRDIGYESDELYSEHLH